MTDTSSLDTVTGTQALERFVDSGALDNVGPKTIDSRVSYLKQAFNAFGRNEVGVPSLATTVQIPQDDVVVSTLNPAEFIDVKRLRKRLRDRKKASSPATRGQPKPAPPKHCPPVGIGMYSAMLVQVAKKVVADLLKTPEEIAACNFKTCRTIVYRSCILRDMQLRLVLAKRGESELVSMARYTSIYVLIGEQRVPLRVLQLYSMEVCLQYLRAGFPVFFECAQAKNNQDAPPYTVGITFKPDELTLLCPIAGTLVHYQVNHVADSHACHCCYQLHMSPCRCWTCTRRG
jgi:hypothetical protein